ncbi:hypothetical protein OROGR_019376 [Orobanche gracilis]
MLYSRVLAEFVYPVSSAVVAGDADPVGGPPCPDLSSIRRIMTAGTLFPNIGFIPLGFSILGFNEASQLYPAVLSPWTDPLASIALPTLWFACTS